MSARSLASRVVQTVDPGHVPPRDQHRLERPDRPEGHQHRKRLVLAHDALAARAFQRQVVAQQTAPLDLAIGKLGCLLLRNLVRQVLAGTRSGSADAGCCTPSSRRGSRRSERSGSPGSAPSSANCAIHVSTTARSSAWLIRATVRSCRGEKHTTRQTPGSASATSSPPSVHSPAGVSGRNAAKSFSKTNVEVVRRDSSRRPRAHCPGTDSSRGRTRAACGGAVCSTCPCQGRWVRCGETRTHSPVSGLNRRCGCSLSLNMIRNTLRSRKPRPCRRWSRAAGSAPASRA